MPAEKTPHLNPRPTDRRSPIHLTVEAYDAAEREALIRVPNRLIECCQPMGFSAVGYPVRVSNDRALNRFVEVMHEVRMPQIASHLGRLTQDEIELIRSVASAVAQMTERLYGVRRVPRESLLDALHICRHITYLHPGQKRSVLEIGPGSGYVGALLTLLGHPYTGTDITQAFYLYQSHLLAELTKGKFSEGVLNHSAAQNAGTCHLPWWAFYLPDGNASLSAEIVTCNHALCEMHPHARSYVLKITADLLKKTPDGALIFFSFGSPVTNPIRDVVRTAIKSGLRIVHNDDRITVMVGPHHPDVMQSLPLDEIGENFELPSFVNELSLIGRAIIDGRKTTNERATHSIEEVDALLSSILGSQCLKTPDQRFLGFVSLD
jgi:SAM-dependent methyltransferase